MKKILAIIFACFLISTSLFTLTACNGANGNQAEKDPQTLAIYNLYVANAESNGEQPLSYEEWLASIKGEKGDPGLPGQNGKDGVDGQDGKDGVTPTIEISEDGYWVINGVKTEYKAIGVDGANGSNGQDGKDGVDGSNGQDGKDGKDGVDGATIKKVEFDEQGRLVITLTDGTVLEPVEIPKMHTFGEWIVFSDNDATCEEKIFYRICSKCDEMEFKHGSYSNHDWSVVTTEPTCQAQGYDTKTCDICGKEEKVNYTPISDHNWEEEYRTDNSFHWIKCKDCEEINSKAEHSTDDSGYCTICGGAVGSTVGILYDLSSDGSYAEVIGYEGTAKNIIIASEYQGKPVKNIYNEAFKRLSIKSVVIPDSVTSIGEYAFNGCTSLTSVVIGDSVTSIGEGAFRACDSLTSIEIGDSVTSIGDWAFANCNNKLYTTENNLQYIKANDNPYFMLDSVTNKNLSTYTINNTTKYILPSAFYGCARLTSIEIPNGVTNISSHAFYICSSLTSIKIPDSVKNIGVCSFDGCASLTSVVIGDGVTSIGGQAFSSCTKLTDIYCYAESKPSGWDSYWKGWGCTAKVHWGYKGE